MIGDLFAIFRARRDPALAARLAAKFAQGQLFDRVTAPLFIVQLILWAAILISGLLVLGALTAGFLLHWSAALPGLLPLGLGTLAVIVQRGLGRSLDAVKTRADTLTDQGMDRLLPLRPVSEEQGPKPNL